MKNNQVATVKNILTIAHKLPDNSGWQNRFEIKSQSSNKIYIVAQSKKLKHWGCSCPGWIFGRKCKHLTAIGLPNHMLPFEPKVKVLS